MGQERRAPSWAKDLQRVVQTIVESGGHASVDEAINARLARIQKADRGIEERREP